MHNEHCALCTMSTVHCAQCTMHIVHNAQWSLVPCPWSLVLVLVPGPWSLVPGPWSLVLVPGPGPWSLVHGPWSMVLVPGPWSLVPGPWSVVPGPWYQRSIQGTGFSPIGSIWELWRYSDHHPTQNFRIILDRSRVKLKPSRHQQLKKSLKVLHRKS